jgi:hypothetical protein
VNPDPARRRAGQDPPAGAWLAGRERALPLGSCPGRACGLWPSSRPCAGGGAHSRRDCRRCRATARIAARGYCVVLLREYPTNEYIAMSVVIERQRRSAVGVNITAGPGRAGTAGTARQGRVRPLRLEGHGAHLGPCTWAGPSARLVGADASYHCCRAASESAAAGFQRGAVPALPNVVLNVPRNFAESSPARQAQAAAATGRQCGPTAPNAAHVTNQVQSAVQ